MWEITRGWMLGEGGGEESMNDLLGDELFVQGHR